MDIIFKELILTGEFQSKHWNTQDGVPEGGSTFGNGFAISWQRGPLGRELNRVPPNGAFVEDIIAAAKDRLDYYQGSRFACHENADAIKHLAAALDILHARTAKREDRKVEGTAVI